MLQVALSIRRRHGGSVLMGLINKSPKFIILFITHRLNSLPVERR